MDFDDKLLAAKHFLQSKGIAPMTYAPPLYRLLWHLGIKVAPPHFSSFRVTALLSGGAFGTFFAMTMSLLIWTGVLPHRPLSTLGIGKLFVFMLLLSGVFFGLFTGRYFQRESRKNAIPTWINFNPRE